MKNSSRIFEIFDTRNEFTSIDIINKYAVSRQRKEERKENDESNFEL